MKLSCLWEQGQSSDWHCSLPELGPVGRKKRGPRKGETGVGREDGKKKEGDTGRGRETRGGGGRHGEGEGETGKGRGRGGGRRGEGRRG